MRSAASRAGHVRPNLAVRNRREASVCERGFVAGQFNRAFVAYASKECDTWYQAVVVGERVRAGTISCLTLPLTLQRGFCDMLRRVIMLAITRRIGLLTAKDSGSTEHTVSSYKDLQRRHVEPLHQHVEAHHTRLRLGWMGRGLGGNIYTR